MPHFPEQSREYHLKISLIKRYLNHRSTSSSKKEGARRSITSVTAVGAYKPPWPRSKASRAGFSAGSTSWSCSSSLSPADPPPRRYKYNAAVVPRSHRAEGERSRWIANDILSRYLFCINLIVLIQKCSNYTLKWKRNGSKFSL